MVPSSSVPQAVLTFSPFRRPKDRHVNLQCRYLLSLHRVVRRIHSEERCRFSKAGGSPGKVGGEAAFPRENAINSWTNAVDWPGA